MMHPQLQKQLQSLGHTDVDTPVSDPETWQKLLDMVSSSYSACMDTRGAFLASFPVDNPHPVLRIHTDGEILFMNATAKALIGDKLPPIWWRMAHQAAASGRLTELDYLHDTYHYNYHFTPVDENVVNIYGLDITDRTRAQQELHHINVRLEALLENLHAGILVEDETRHIVVVNQHFCNMFSIPAPAFTMVGADCSRSAQETKHLFADPEGFVTRVDEIITAKQLVLGEEIELNSGLVYERDYIPIVVKGDYRGHLWQYRDITARKQIQREMLVTENRYRSLFENNNDAVFIINTNGTIIDANHRAATLLGYDLFELIGMDARQNIKVDEDVEFKEDIIFAGFSVPIYERTFVRSDGTEIPCEINIIPVYDRQEDRLLHIQSIVRDISERKQAEKSLQSQQLRLRALYEITSRFDMDLATQMVAVLHMGIELLGLQTGIVSQIVDDHYMILHHYSMNPMLELHNKQLFELKATYCDITIQENNVVSIEHMALSDYRGHPCYPQFQLEAYIGAPLIVDGQQYGSVSFNSLNPAPQPFTEADRDFVRLISLWIGSAIERDLATQAIRKSENLYRTVITNAPILLWACDENGEITLSDGKVTKSFGRAPGEVVGQSVFDLYQDAPQIIDNVKRALMGETFRKKLDIGNLVLDSYYNPMFDNEGRVEGVIGLAVDISEQHRMQAELAKSRDQALEASRLKSEFLAMMSHEIRTPMNGIIGMSELLQDTDLDEEQKEFSNIISQEAYALLKIINDILDFSKIEADKVILEEEPIDIGQVVESVVNINAPKANDKALAIGTNITDELPALLGDAGRLRQVLMNLVSNAIKFTHEGYVRIEVSLINHTSDEVLLRFSVIDSGIGMPAEALERLFQPFTQVDGSTTRKYGGTGLGLAIVKRLVELMGGEVGIQSIEGQGSTFWFTACFKRNPSQPHEAVLAPSSDETIEEPENPAPEKRPYLLLVEDNSMNRDLAQLQLERIGYQVDAVTNGKEAVERLVETGDYYSLVLMDCEMPIMDGFEATRTIRRQEAISGKHIPIIAMTAKAIQGDRDMCLAAGMDDYIAKPVKLQILKMTLKRWLDDSSSD